jgi:hypothetical protein
MQTIAWQLDTTKPNDPGETTFERLTMNAALRRHGEPEYPFRIPSPAVAFRAPPEEPRI